jgi:hypothetical protein
MTRSNLQIVTIPELLALGASTARARISGTTDLQRYLAI